MCCNPQYNKDLFVFKLLFLKMHLKGLGWGSSQIGVLNLQRVNHIQAFSCGSCSGNFFFRVGSCFGNQPLGKGSAGLEVVIPLYQ
jgi:hypothetical protein